jgi:hypothetical protein
MILVMLPGINDILNYTIFKHRFVTVATRSLVVESQSEIAKATLVWPTFATAIVGLSGLDCGGCCLLFHEE